jgi:hypothetical protein
VLHVYMTLVTYGLNVLFTLTVVTQQVSSKF